MADSAKLPFATNSIDLIITDHSLEPNGSRLEEVLKELFRISKRYCVFIEPSNAIQSREGMQRMRSLGYIFDLEETIKNLGGVIISEHNAINNYNELNKSKMSIVKVPERKLENKESNNYKKIFTYPGTDYHLEKKGNFLQNKESGFLFPILEEIPILLEQNRILLSNY